MLNSFRFALALLLPLALAACSPPSTPSAPVAFYGDGLDHSWTANAQEGQKIYQTLSKGLKTQGVDMGVTLDITASNGWGPIEVNASNGETAAGDGKTLTMKGKTYATGLGVHGDSEIHIQATGLVTPACTRFKADIGIDDEVGANGKYSSVVFQVFADGEKLYDSGLVTGSTPTKSIDIPVGNKSDLRFVVTHGPDLNYYDHADWAGATLSCAATPPETGPSSVTLEQNRMGISHLHSSALNVTFNHFDPGPVQLRLVLDSNDPESADYHGSEPFKLETPTLELSGNPSEVRIIEVSAPGTAPLSVSGRLYHLIVIRNGQDISDSPLTIQEIPLVLGPSLSEFYVIVKNNTTKTLTFTVTVDPPLDGPRPITLAPIGNGFDFVSIVGISPVRGDGHTMQVDVTLKFYSPSGSAGPNVRQYFDYGIEGVKPLRGDGLYSGGFNANVQLQYFIMP